MMTWLILGIIAFLIEFLILKNTTFFKYDYDRNVPFCSQKYKRTEEQPLKIKLWVVLLLAVGNLPAISIITFVVFWIVYIVKVVETEPTMYETYWRLRSKKFRKLIDFLNKEI